METGVEGSTVAGGPGRGDCIMEPCEGLGRTSPGSDVDELIWNGTGLVEVEVGTSRNG